MVRRRPLCHYDTTRTAVLVVSFGRLGDMFGRVRMFNLGFAIFALFSVLLSVTWLHGTAAATDDHDAERLQTQPAG